MEQQNSSELIVQGDEMSIQQDAQDYYYNDTAGYSCWGGGEYTQQGYYEPSNYYMLNNAKLIYYDLRHEFGWSYNSIMAVLGNMAYESSLNPAQYEIGYNKSNAKGYGLCQWTPCGTTIKQWLTSNNHPLTSGYWQLHYLNQGTGWVTKSAYGNMTWSQFKSSTLSVDYLTEVFFNCYEIGTDNPYRYYCASYYADYFGGAQTGNTIFVTSEGNGNAYAVPSSVNIDDNFTLNAIANGDDELVRIDAVTESGQSIAMEQVPVYTYRYLASYGAYILVHVVFTGNTPPIPPVVRFIKKHMPIWMYPRLRKR